MRDRWTGRWFGLGAALLIAAAGGLTSAGCASTGSARTGTVDVALVSAGEVIVDGERLPVDRLPRKLKRMGARSATPIRIEIPEQMPMRVVSSVTTSLARAGFRRVLFRRPRQTEITTEARGRN